MDRAWFSVSNDWISVNVILFNVQHDGMYNDLIILQSKIIAAEVM